MCASNAIFGGNFEEGVIGATNAGINVVVGGLDIGNAQVGEAGQSGQNGGFNFGFSVAAPSGDVAGATSSSGGGSYRDGYFSRGLNYVIGKQDYGSAPITDQERKFSEAGNRRAFWKSRLNKDPLAGFALDIIDSIQVGGLANKRLIAYGQWKGLNVNLEEVGIALMRAHVKAVNNDDKGVRYLLSPDQVAEYHHDVFAEFNLPRSTFGGTSTGNLRETSISRGFWCLGCDWNE